MGRIRSLSDVEKKKIAAGEVVEGPSSVLKELIENSLDAGADEIDVTIEESGLKRIQVSDNGSGIYRDDIELAIAEHATSKIANIYDIDTIASFGFRGEALSSISSISRLTILSRHADEEFGARLESRDGNSDTRDYAGPAGTTVIVENLFYNTPARKKFLKARRTEMRYLREIFLKLALANFAVTFTLEVDGKRYITLMKAGTIEERMRQIYARDTVDNLYFDRLQDLKVEAYGFFSRPDFLRSSRTMQMLFVNGRPVENRYFGFHLSRAYEAVAPKGQYPAGIVFIDIEPELIDVNVHPTKKEVKFFDQKYIDSLIVQLAEKVLNRTHEITGRHFRAAPKVSETAVAEEGVRDLPYEKQAPDLSGLRETAAGDPSSFIVKELPESYRKEAEDTGYRVIGIAFNTYIIVEKGASLYFIDFHAAHERVIFDSLMERDEVHDVQDLMFPRVIELSMEDFHLVMDHHSAFSDMGFQIDEFADSSITVRAVPEIAKNIDGETFIREFLENVKDESGREFSITKKIAASVACHAAKRAGDRLSGDDMAALIEESMDENRDRRCPHGRPYVFSIDKNSLEKIFKRE